MRGNTLFIIGLIFIFIIGIAGVAWKEGFISLPSSENENNTPSTKTSSNSSVTSASQRYQINKIDSSLIGQNIELEGAIDSRFDHKNGHVFLTVTDATGAIPVVIFKDKGIATETYQPGKNINVIGHVKEYNSKLEIIVENESDISIRNDFQELTIGERVELRAKVLSKYVHPEGHLFLNVVLENDQEISIPLFKNLKPESSDFSVYSTIKVIGTVEEYNGRLEIIPDSMKAIEILEAGNESEIEDIDIKDITELDRGKMVITEGFVKNIQIRDDGHLMFYLEDNDSSIYTVLFRADSEEISGRKDRIVHAEKAQFPVRVVAMVDIYDNELELIVDKVLVD